MGKGFLRKHLMALEQGIRFEKGQIYMQEMRKAGDHGASQDTPDS